MTSKAFELLSTSLIGSCIFENIENASEIISGPSFDIYESLFINCNKDSHEYSIRFTKEVYISNTYFESSGGFCCSFNEVNPPSTVRLQSILANNIRSECYVSVSQTQMDIYQINLTNSIGWTPLNTANGPKQFLSKFVSLVSNDCDACAKLEADYGCLNQNSYYQFVRNICSRCLFEVYRADCFCDWFYFIDNSNTSCRQIGSHTIFFTNSFMSSDLIVLTGTTSGIVSLNKFITELPFPGVVIRKPMTGSSMRSMVMMIIGIVFFLFS